MKRASNEARTALRSRSPTRCGGRDRLVDVLDQEAGPGVVDDFGRRSATEGDHRCAAGHRFDHHHAERLGPVDRKQQRRRFAEELGLLLLIDLADELDPRIAVDHRLDALGPVVLIDAVDLGRDLQPRADAGRDLDRAVGTFFGRNPPEKGEVAAPGRRIERQEMARQAVVDHAGPVHRRHGPALVERDRDQRRAGEDRVEATALGHVEPAVQRRHRAVDEVADQRIVQNVDVKVKDVEFVRHLAHRIQHHDVMRRRVLDAGIEPQGGVAERKKAGGRGRIAAGEQRHVVAEPHQFLGQIGDDPLGAPVLARRNTLHQRGDLGDFHGCVFPLTRNLGSRHKTSERALSFQKAPRRWNCDCRSIGLLVRRVTPAERGPADPAPLDVPILRSHSVLRRFQQRLVVRNRNQRRGGGRRGNGIEYSDGAGICCGLSEFVVALQTGSSESPTRPYIIDMCIS